MLCRNFNIEKEKPAKQGILALKMGGVLYGRQEKEKYCSNNFGKSGTQFCKSSSEQQMYVLPSSAQAADRNEKAFPIRTTIYGMKYCHMREEIYICGSILGKEVRSIHFQCIEFKNIQ